MDRRTLFLAPAFGLIAMLFILVLTPGGSGLSGSSGKEIAPPAASPAMARELAREARGAERGLLAALERPSGDHEPGGELEEGNAWDYFQWWYGIRAYPNELIPEASFYQGWQHARADMPSAGMRDASTWSSIGPTNIGGRMLSLAIDPSDTQVIWAGAASGGLWKSVTGGEGSSAWTRVETGFPSLSVSSIAIDRWNPDVMYIGTGEISLYARPMDGTPGARASYGIGILKSSDGGATWGTTGLTWTFDQHRAILSIRQDPADENTLYAATSEGLYKTADAGASWTNIHPVLMAMDVVIDPVNHNRVFVSHGQLNSTPNPGIYRSTDAGSTWTQLTSGLPSSNFGRTPLLIYSPTPAAPSILWAGVSDANTRQAVGLFKSTNGGDTWSNVAPVNWAGGQAWYDNVIGYNLSRPNQILCGGLDWYRSTTGGSGLAQVSYWYTGYDGQIPPGGAEGPPSYVHADMHAIAFDPTDANIVYIGCDGGVFKSNDGGVHWAGKNGGLVTTQFYAGFAGGFATSGLALGGLQDNGTIKYTGDPAWWKVFGGDGGWCAIDPTNEDVVYEEYVYLDMYKSWDGGLSWSEIHPGSSSEANFIAPFVLSETNPNIIYAGTRGVQKSTNGGSSWFYPDGNSNWNGTPMAIIGVSYTSPDTVLAGTGSGSTGAIVELRRSSNGGISWTNITAGLPDRYPTDFAFNRNDSRDVWLTFSGFGGPHVFRSRDAGLTWTDCSGNLPDVPVQCAVVDPMSSDWVYIGTDLGVFVTVDGGADWMRYDVGMPPAMILDLVIHPQDRRMRAATFGNGVYEIQLMDSPAAVAEGAPGASTPLLAVAGGSPNPFRGSTSLSLTLARESNLHCAVFDASGRSVRVLFDGRRAAGSSSIRWDGRDAAGMRVPAGAYFVRTSAGAETRVSKVMLVP